MGENVTFGPPLARTPFGWTPFGLDPLWFWTPFGRPPLDQPPLTDPLWRTSFNPESLPLGLSISLLGRCVVNYEIGCVNANSAMQFEEGPRLGVFDKVKFISKKAKKENN